MRSLRLGCAGWSIYLHPCGRFKYKPNKSRDAVQLHFTKYTLPITHTLHLESFGLYIYIVSRMYIYSDILKVFRDDICYIDTKVRWNEAIAENTFVCVVWWCVFSSHHRAGDMSVSIAHKTYTHTLYIKHTHTEHISIILFTCALVSHSRATSRNIRSKKMYIEKKTIRENTHILEHTLKLTGWR